MRRTMSIVSISLGLTLPARTPAQPSPAPPPVSVMLIRQPWRVRVPASPDAMARHAAVPLVESAAQEHEHHRRTFIAVGALVGAVGGAVLVVRDSRHGALGYLGGFLVLPIGMAGGMIVGGAAGYLVSLVVYPPWSDGARGMAPGVAVRIDVRGW